METGICRDLRTTCARSDYRVNGITALSARQGVAVGAVTYSARKSRSDPKKAAGRGGIVQGTLGGKYSPEPPLRLIKHCFSGLQRFLPPKNPWDFVEPPKRCGQTVVLHLFAAAIFRDPISYPKHRGGEVYSARKLRDPSAAPPTVCAPRP